MNYNEFNGFSGSQIETQNEYAGAENTCFRIVITVVCYLLTIIARKCIKIIHTGKSVFRMNAL